MELSSLPVTTVRSSFRRCCDREDFIDTFYHLLACAAPETAPMFAETDMKTQDTLVRSGIGHLIDFAAGVVGMSSKIRELGVKHNRLNIDVEPRLYASWLNALMEAISECDERFDEHLEGAWRAVLIPGMRLMMEEYDADM